MNNSRGRSWSAALAAGLLLLTAGTVRPCTTPVFQYALERWEADPYKVHITVTEATRAAEEAAIKLLEEAAEQADGANIHVRTTPADGFAQKEDEATAAVEPRPKGSTMTVYFPLTYGPDIMVWQGTPSEEAARRVVNSPARNELVRRLLGGDAAVWLFLPSGNRDKDEPALTLLKAELAKMAETLQIPAEPLPPTQTLAAVPDQPVDQMPVSFSVIELCRDDPQESFLVDTLLRTEPDLRDFDEPMAFPVYGRGRCLYALVGKGINADTIAEACVFVTGPCSCQVKALNPGVDLLVRANWNAYLDTLVYTEEELPPLTGILPDGEAGGQTALAAAHQSAEATETGLLEEHAPDAAAVPAAPSGASSVLGRAVTLAFGLLLASAIFGTVLLHRKTEE